MPFEVRLQRRKQQDELSQPERLALLQLTHTPGFDVLLDLMEMECNLAEGEMVGADPSNAEQVLAAHKLARAAWTFFVRVQKRVQAELVDVGNAITLEREPAGVGEEREAESG